MSLEETFCVSILLSDYMMDLVTQQSGLKFFLTDKDRGFGEISFKQTELEISNIGLKFAPSKVNHAKPTVSRKRPNTDLKVDSAINTKPKTQSSGLPHEARQPEMGFQQNPDDFVSASQDLDSGAKSFSCKFCGYSAAVRQNVTRHINLKHITGGTVIKCNLCVYTTKLKADMKKHYMKKHELPENMAKAALS